MKAELKQAEVIQELQSKMKALSSRDLQLWSIGLLIIVVLAAGIAALVVPNLMWGGRQVVVADKYLPQLLYGFIALIVLFNVYVLWQRRELDNSRQELVSEMMFNLRVKNLSLVDPLTEAFNRRYFDQVVAKETSMADRHASTVSFVLVEIQNIRDINSQFGYLAGDGFLIELAGMLRNRAGTCDTVVRYGGDEFLLMLPDRDEEQAAAVAQQLFADVNAWNQAPERQYMLLVNCSAATYRQGVAIKDVLRQAENRLRPATNPSRGLGSGEPTSAYALVSTDSVVQEVIAPILDSMGISVELCSRADEALQKMAWRRMDAVIVDCDLEGGEPLLTQARALASSRGTVMIALTSGEAGRKAGANILLEKPLNAALTARSLRVAHALVRAEQVRYLRYVVTSGIAAVFTPDGGKPQRCCITGISGTGMAVRKAAALPDPETRRAGDAWLRVGGVGPMRFRLADKNIEIQAEVAWCDGQGCAGFRFTDAGHRPHPEIQRWLDQKAAEEDIASRKSRARPPAA